MQAFLLGALGGAVIVAVVWAIDAAVARREVAARMRYWQRGYWQGWRDGVDSVWLHAHGFTDEAGNQYPALGLETSARWASRAADQKFRDAEGVHMDGLSVFDQMDAGRGAVQ